MSNNYYIIKRMGVCNLLRILVADDNREFNELLSNFLENEPDIEVVGRAYNGKEALKLVEDTQPDILLAKSYYAHCFWP